MQMTRKSLALCAMLLTVSIPLFNGCAKNPKSVVVAFPGYMELPAESTAVAEMNFGSGPESKAVKLDRIYYCYDQPTQEDVLAMKKGK